MDFTIAAFHGWLSRWLLVPSHKAWSAEIVHVRRGVCGHEDCIREAPLDQACFAARQPLDPDGYAASLCGKGKRAAELASMGYDLASLSMSQPAMVTAPSRALHAEGLLSGRRRLCGRCSWSARRLWPDKYGSERSA